MSLHLLPTIVLITHWLMVIGLSVRVIMRRPPVGVSVAWLMVIFSVPFIGGVLYLLFGEKRLGRARSERIEANAAGLREWQVGLRPGDSVALDGRAHALSCHIERTLGFLVSGGNQVELLVDFESIFDAIVADIDDAQQKVHLSFYIWFAGGRTDDVVAALIRASRRGVECRALADGLGSKPFLAGADAERLCAAGVELVTALPTGLLRTLFVRADLRNHRKIVVIDDQVAYTGSQIWSTRGSSSRITGSANGWMRWRGSPVPRSLLSMRCSSSIGRSRPLVRSKRRSESRWRRERTDRDPRSSPRDRTSSRRRSINSCSVPSTRLGLGTSWS